MSNQSKQLIYFADPMCSWCWGFSPVISSVRGKYGEKLPVRLILGGLRPGTKEPMREIDKADIREHWEHVHEASGQAFDFSFFDRDGFVYDTGPSSQAVVAVRRLRPGLELDFLGNVQKGFYAQGLDVTDRLVLGGLAAELEIGEKEFLDEYDSEEARKETSMDFAIARKTGIRGFPSLLAGEEGGQFRFICRGYLSWDDMEAPLDNWFLS